MGGPGLPGAMGGLSLGPGTSGDDGQGVGAVAAEGVAPGGEGGEEGQGGAAVPPPTSAGVPPAVVAEKKESQMISYDWVSFNCIGMVRRCLAKLFCLCS